MNAQHTPVLVEETMNWLAIKPGGLYVDVTVGLGGHA
ncbi:MAG: 16S rRNA (cytosine(1402)-N(4))-methyltransferase, partial [Candidatus Acidiferrales bacterium]